MGLFKGTQAYKNVAGNAMINAWPKSIGSSRIFSTITIDATRSVPAPIELTSTVLGIDVAP